MDRGTRAGKGRHVVFSFQWDSVTRVKKIKDHLEKQQFISWPLDADRSSGLSLMSDLDVKFKNAVAVIIFCTRKYMDSKYCRSESSYAWQIGCTIIPVLLEEGFSPTGWLSTICHSSQGRKVNLSNKELYYANIGSLVAVLKKLLEKPTMRFLPGETLTHRNLGDGLKDDGPRRETDIKFLGSQTPVMHLIGANRYRKDGVADIARPTTVVPFQGSSVTYPLETVDLLDLKVVAMGRKLTIVGDGWARPQYVHCQNRKYDFLTWISDYKSGTITALSSDGHRATRFRLYHDDFDPQNLYTRCSTIAITTDSSNGVYVATCCCIYRCLDDGEVLSHRCLQQGHGHDVIRDIDLDEENDSLYVAFETKILVLDSRSFSRMYTLQTNDLRSGTRAHPRFLKMIKWNKVRRTLLILLSDGLYELEANVADKRSKQLTIFSCPTCFTLSHKGELVCGYYDSETTNFTVTAATFRYEKNRIIFEDDGYVSTLAVSGSNLIMCQPLRKRVHIMRDALV